MLCVIFNLMLVRIMNQTTTKDKKRYDDFVEALQELCRSHKVSLSADDDHQIAVGDVNSEVYGYNPNMIEIYLKNEIINSDGVTP